MHVRSIVSRFLAQLQCLIAQFTCISLLLLLPPFVFILLIVLFEIS